MAGIKPTKMEHERRVTRVYELKLSGMSRSGIIHYAANPDPEGVTHEKPWNVKPRTIDSYIAAANERFAEASKTIRAEELGKAVNRLNNLYARFMGRGDLTGCRMCQKDLSDLLGLEAPKRSEFSGPNGEPLVPVSTEDLAARFDQLVRDQAHRLKEKKARGV
jgi:hypothetical protein